jgi:stress response protein YsnF
MSMQKTAPESLGKQDLEVVHAEDGDAVIPLLTEQIAVTRRTVVTGRVQVQTVTREGEHLVDELLSSQQVEVERVPVGKVVDSIPAVREDDNEIVVPVVEEILTVQRRLILKEEVHIRKTRSSRRHQERVPIRRQEAVVTRLPPKAATAED